MPPIEPVTPESTTPLAAGGESAASTALSEPGNSDRNVSSGPAPAEPAVPQPDACPPATRFLGLSRGDTWFAAVVGTLILGLMVVHWATLTWQGESRVEIDRLPARAYEFQLDINRATWVEWMQLEDIGEGLARRIVADRDAHGPFSSVDDLQRVKGIGPRTLEGIRLHLNCPDCPPSTEAQP